MSTNEETLDLSSEPELEQSGPQPAASRLLWILGGLILVCGVGIGFGASMLLRGPRHSQGMLPPPPPGEIARHLKEKYSLTDEQVLAVEKVFAGLHQEMGGLREEMHGRRKAAIERLKKELQSVLTVEQYERWSKDFEEHRRHRGFGRGRPGKESDSGGRQGPPPPPPPPY